VNRAALAAVFGLVAASHARADNKGGGSWECVAPGTWSTPGSTCVAEASVPEGCPIHVVVPHKSLLTPPTSARVARGRGPYTAVLVNGDPHWAYRPAGRELAITARITIDSTFVQTKYYMDFYANCDQVTGRDEFDRATLSLTGARGGDVLLEWGDSRSGVAITAQAPCPPAQWPPIKFHEGSCDKMPVIQPAKSSVAPSTPPPAVPPEPEHGIDPLWALPWVIAVGFLIAILVGVLRRPRRPRSPT
jgi:hypothetical protein